MLDAAVVRQAVSGVEAAVVALGSTPDNPDMICTHGAGNVIEAMGQAAAGKRLW